MTARAVLPASCIGLLSLVGCSDSVAPKVAVEHLIAVDGGGQSGATLDTLPDWLVVRVVNDGGDPLAGVPVAWSSEDETGQAIPVDRVTDPEGTARAIAVLGFTPGAQRFHARVEGFDAQVTFEVEAAREPTLKAVSLMNAGGSYHMCGLDAEGRAWCWGDNFYGQLGDGTTERRSVARPVLTPQRFTSLAGSFSITCGIAVDRSLWCWGYNGTPGSGDGQFGNGGTEGSTVPVPAATGLSVVDIDIDGPTSCAVTTVGEAWCWGRIITPDSNMVTAVPVKVESAERWRDISVSGPDRVCAVSLDYEVFCWASGANGAELAGLTGEFRSPQPVPGIPPVVSISVSWWNQCAQLAGGSGAVCWGRYINGGNSPDAIQYPRVRGGGIARILARAETGMVLGTDGQLHIWGEPPQCCDGFISSTPVALGQRGPWLDFGIGEVGVFGIHAADSTVHFWYPFLGSPTEMVPQPVRTLE